jgi:hypothetical protein
MENGWRPHLKALLLGAPVIAGLVGLGWLLITLGYHSLLLIYAAWAVLACYCTGRAIMAWRE